MSKDNHSIPEELALSKRSVSKMPPMPKMTPADNISQVDNAKSSPSLPKIPSSSAEGNLPHLAHPSIPYIINNEAVTSDNPIIGAASPHSNPFSTPSRGSLPPTPPPKSNSPKAISQPNLEPTTPPETNTQAVHDNNNSQLPPEHKSKYAFLSVENARTVFYRGENVTRIPLGSEPIIIGRRDVLAGLYPDVDLGDYWNFDRSISRKHLRIFKDASGAYLAEDLCSHNATFLNSTNQPMSKERIELHDGDKIYISCSIIFTFNCI